MLYVFRIVGTGYVKMGFTRGNPWRRVSTGFWSNVHPSDCCHKLGWENLELVALFEGDMTVEFAIKSVVHPFCGEFWADSKLKLLLNMMEFLCVKLPLPSKPLQPLLVDRGVVKRPCCGGNIFTCADCDRTFNCLHHLIQHNESHMKLKVSCTACGKGVLKRNLKRHESRCKR